MSEPKFWVKQRFDGNYWVGLIKDNEEEPNSVEASSNRQATNEHPGRWPVHGVSSGQLATMSSCEPCVCAPLKVMAIRQTRDYILQLERERDELRAMLKAAHERLREAGYVVAVVDVPVPQAEMGVISKLAEDWKAEREHGDK